jgi:hypothetical protein
VLSCDWHRPPSIHTFRQHRPPLLIALVFLLRLTVLSTPATSPSMSLSPPLATMLTALLTLPPPTPELPVGGEPKASHKGATTAIPTSWAPFGEGYLQDLRPWVGTLCYFSRDLSSFRVTECRLHSVAGGHRPEASSK